MKLNEWTKGKGIVMMDRLFKVLSKKTGETYKICQIPEIYQNRYGKFVGYYVVGSSGTVYRANFVVNASTENVVSLDRFDKNDDKLITPKDTLSFEGFNIVQIYNCVLDWMRGQGKALTIGGFKECVALHEGKWNDVMAQFLQQQPNWIKDSQSGNMDQALFFKSYKDFCKMSGVSGDPGPLSYAIKTFQSTLASGRAGSAGKVAAKNVAVPAAFPGSPSKPIPTNDELIQKYGGGNAKEWAAFLDDLEKPETSNPMGVIAHYREYIQDMAEAPEYTKSGCVAWGKGGTGKTFHAEESLKALGMSKNVNYCIIDNLKGGAGVFLGALYDIEQDDMAFAIVDDCDIIFTEKYRNHMLHVLAPDAKDRHLTINEAGLVTPKGRKIEPGTEIDISNCKFIFCTNKDVTQLDSAWTSRVQPFNFDFTDSEMLTLIGDSLERMLPDDPNLDKATKLKLFQMLSAGVEKGIVRNVNFRTMNATLLAYSLAILRGRDPIKAVSVVMKTSF